MGLKKDLQIAVKQKGRGNALPCIFTIIYAERRIFPSTRDKLGPPGVPTYWSFLNIRHRNDPCYIRNVYYKPENKDVVPLKSRHVY